MLKPCSLFHRAEIQANPLILQSRLTIPNEIGEVQKDVGLAEKGSFVLSVKNPESSAPANAQLPQGAEYPKEIIDEFRE